MLAPAEALTSRGTLRNHPDLTFGLPVSEGTPDLISPRYSHAFTPVVKARRVYLACLFVSVLGYRVQCLAFSATLEVVQHSR